MISMLEYVSDFEAYFPGQKDLPPWDFIANIQKHITRKFEYLGRDYVIDGDVAVHESATIEAHVVLKGPLIISPGCFLGAHSYFRGGVLLGQNVSIGPGCEIKSSVILDKSRLAHFNFAGDSVIGSDVNFEAGSVLANYHNDRADKSIFIRDGKLLIPTGVKKFGALIGDHCRIGANSVCSPGTLLLPNSVVMRLELIAQDLDKP